MADSFIQRRPPNDGPDYDAQCARCGSTLSFEPCEACGGEPYYDDGICATCDGCGGEAPWPLCISSVEWCLANPLPGRADIQRSTPEWFRVDHVCPSQATPDKDKETDR